MNRDFKQLLTMIQAVALLHQCQRERDEHGRIIATLDDYRMVRELLLDVFTAAATGGITPVVRATVKALHELYDGKNPVMMKQIADHLKLHKSTALYRVRAAQAGGYIVNEETRKFQPAKLVPGDSLPEERPALPEPEALNAPAPYHPESTPTVEPSTDGRSYDESEKAVQLSVQPPIEPALNQTQEDERLNQGSIAVQPPVEPSATPISDTNTGVQGRSGSTVQVRSGRHGRG